MGEAQVEPGRTGEDAKERDDPADIPGIGDRAEKEEGADGEVREPDRLKERVGLRPPRKSGALSQIRQASEYRDQRQTGKDLRQEESVKRELDPRPGEERIRFAVSFQRPGCGDVRPKILGLRDPPFVESDKAAVELPPLGVGRESGEELRAKTEKGEIEEKKHEPRRSESKGPQPGPDKRRQKEGKGLAPDRGAQSRARSETRRVILRPTGWVSAGRRGISSANRRARSSRKTTRGS